MVVKKDKIDVLVMQITAAERISRDCDIMLKQEFEKTYGKKISNLVTAFYEGCAFAWESVSEDPMKDLAFGLSLDKQAILAQLAA
ncbi:MAG TPA: hypothetical protein VM577_07350 [Anaerovoracaceae bacterium]|nr:hypothetical protein [Anaerovoracaceae bacterium]